MRGEFLDEEGAQLEVPVDPGRGLEAELEAAGVEVQASDGRFCQFGYPWPSQAQRGEEGAASVALMYWEALLPLLCDVEKVDDHVGLEDRPRRPRHLHPPAFAARGIGGEQLVLDRVVEDLREQVEDHVHAPRREAGRLELAPERVDAVRIELGGRVVRQMAKHVVQAPAVVQARVRRELGLAALPPARGGHVDGLLGVDGGARLSVRTRRRLPGPALDLLENAVE